MSELVKETVTQTRRSFLRGAAVVAGAAAAATAPTVAKDRKSTRLNSSH